VHTNWVLIVFQVEMSQLFGKGKVGIVAEDDDDRCPH